MLTVSIRQLDIGEPALLDPTDDSPFKAFGSVLPGQTCPTLYNNLVRAPLFRQNAYDTDFIIVRSVSGIPDDGMSSHSIFSILQKHNQRRIQVLHSRNQDELCHRSDVPDHRSPWTALEKSHRPRQESIAKYRLQARREKSRSNQGAEARQVLP